LEYYKAFGEEGFAAPDEIEVVRRENSGAGRFVELSAPQPTQLAGRICDLPLLVEMEAIEGGLGVVLFLEDGRPDMLELFTFVGDWDGEERPWRVVRASDAPSA
jgi:hypothetical protein